MASPVDTSVKFFRDDFPGAPVLNGVTGSLVGLLDACLVTGFGLRSVSSLVVSGGVATATLDSDAKNANLLRSVIIVDGASITALNGEQKVLFASDNQLKFSTGAADGVATGTITVKTAPAGWTKAFSGTNKGAYKSLDPTSLGMYLRVDDTGGTNANVRGYETMTSLDTGTGLFPTTVESANGGFWAKASNTSAAANRWDLFADSRIFYWCPIAYSALGAGYTGQGAYWFGDIVPYKSGDAFATSISSSKDNTGSNSAPGMVFQGGQAASSGMCRFARSYSGMGSAVSAHAYTSSGATNTYSGCDSSFGVFPAPADGALRLAKILTTEAAISAANAVLRGDMPGVYHAPQIDLYKTFQRGDIVSLTGKKLYAIQCGTLYTEGTANPGVGRGFVDITGPWR